MESFGFAFQTPAQVQVRPKWCTPQKDGKPVSANEKLNKHFGQAGIHSAEVHVFYNIELAKKAPTNQDKKLLNQEEVFSATSRAWALTGMEVMCQPAYVVLAKKYCLRKIFTFGLWTLRNTQS